MSSQFKIIMIGTDMNSCGGMSSVIKLYKESGLLGDNVIYLSSYKDGSIIFKIGFFAVFLVKYLFLLLTDKNIKLVHIHIATKGSFFRKSIALIIAKAFGKKVLLHEHAAEFSIFYDKVPLLIKRYITKIFDSCDAVIALSSQCRAEISEKTANRNIQVLYNPTVVKEIYEKKNETVNVLFMGRLGKRKGTYDIIEAAKHLKADNVEINLYGDGEVNEVQKVVTEAELQGKVKVNGWISGEQKDEVFKSADIYILPSYNEGLPISILEAMAIGLPVITTPVGGIPEAVENGVNGFLIQPGDYAALAQRIDSLAENPDLRKQMGRQSYRIAKEKFDIETVIKQLQDIYSGLIKYNN